MSEDKFSDGLKFSFTDIEIPRPPVATKDISKIKGQVISELAAKSNPNTTLKQVRDVATVVTKCLVRYESSDVASRRKVLSFWGPTPYGKDLGVEWSIGADPEDTTLPRNEFKEFLSWVLFCAKDKIALLNNPTIKLPDIHSSKPVKDYGTELFVRHLFDTQRAGMLIRDGSNRCEPFIRSGMLMFLNSTNDDLIVISCTGMRFALVVDDGTDNEVRNEQVTLTKPSWDVPVSVVRVKFKDE